MQCKKAIWVDRVGMNVPCSQCMPCRINKGRLWSARIIMEWLTCPERSYFVTLTYAPEHIPITLDEDAAPRQTLEKKYFLKWLARVQEKVGPFRYYSVGEYGDYSHRPHYHLAIFPARGTSITAIAGYWRKGFSQISELNHERARYLANYTAKKLTKATDERLGGNQEPEFRTSSRRPPLGAAFVDQLCSHYARAKIAAIVNERGDVERTFRCDGRIYPLGEWPLRRLRKQLGIPLLHRERIAANPNYLNFHESEEAVWDEIEAENQETYLNAKKRQKHFRSESAKV